MKVLQVNEKIEKKNSLKQEVEAQRNLFQFEVDKVIKVGGFNNYTYVTYLVSTWLSASNNSPEINDDIMIIIINLTMKLAHGISVNIIMTFKFC